MNSTIRKLKLNFSELNKALKEYGKTKCVFYNNGSCREPSMGWGGMTRDTECRIDNCPFIISEEVNF